jgi:dihydroorotate dehydrogenase electron transfer subunit
MLTEVIANREVAPSYFKLVLACLEESAAPQPGQFYMARTRDCWNTFLRRPFSAYRYRYEPVEQRYHVEILYKVVGQGTGQLARARKGEGVDLLGPLGQGFSIEERPKAAFLIAGSVGAASLFLLAEEFARRRVRTTLFLGGKTRQDILCVRDLQELGVEVMVATEDGSLGFGGMVSELFEATLESDRRVWHEARYYSCGPWGMLREVSRICHRLEVPLQVCLEARMACGFGSCLGCSARVKGERVGGEAPLYKLVCKDGPVFDSREVVWD